MELPADMRARLSERALQLWDYFSALPPLERRQSGALKRAAEHFGVGAQSILRSLDHLRATIGDLGTDVLPVKGVRKVAESEVARRRGRKTKRFRTQGELEIAAGIDLDTVESSLKQFDRIAPHVRAVRTQELLAMTGFNAARILASMTDADIAQASLKDKAIAFGILTEKRQLLAGEPTQIVSFEDRRKMPELLEALTAEMRRRGREIDVTPTSEAHSNP